MPPFILSIVLIVLLSGGQYLDWFPLRGLTSDNWDEFNLFQKIIDYVWHLTLPVLAIAVGGMASLTMLSKNSFLEEINKQYVLTARAKGLTPNKVLYDLPNNVELNASKKETNKEIEYEECLSCH